MTIITTPDFGVDVHVTGTLAANVVQVIQFPFNCTYLGSTTVSTAASGATLAVAGGATLAATAIGLSSVPADVEPTIPQLVDKNTVMTFTLVYNAGGTAAVNLQMTHWFMKGVV